MSKTARAVEDVSVKNVIDRTNLFGMLRFLRLVSLDGKTPVSLKPWQRRLLVALDKRRRT